MVADVDDLLSEATVAQISIGPDRELLVLSFARPYPCDNTTASPPSGPLAYKIHRRNSAGWELIQTLAPSGKHYSFVQPLPGERWLLVRSLAASASDLNADIFNGSGTILSSFYAGDGIEHVQTTPSGDIWIGYFDEGVFGREELGQSGLACLNDHGKPLFQYRSDIAEPNGLPSIDDCYALNVPNDELVWATYYSDFPLIKLRNKLLDKVWRDFPAKAVKSFAVSDDQLLMVAAYRKEALLYSVDRETVFGRDPTIGFKRESTFIRLLIRARCHSAFRVAKGSGQESSVFIRPSFGASRQGLDVRASWGAACCAPTRTSPAIFADYRPARMAA